jgi:multiple antibiotic resistance protein
MMYVYLLLCRDGSIYTGTAKDLEKRMRDHFEKTAAVAAYTRAKGARYLLAAWECDTRSAALRAEYADINILLGLLANMAFVFFVLTMTDKVQYWMGKGGVYVIRKFFGVILIAVAARLFTDNIAQMIFTISSQIHTAG